MYYDYRILDRVIGYRLGLLVPGYWLLVRVCVRVRVGLALGLELGLGLLLCFMITG